MWEQVIKQGTCNYEEEILCYFLPHLWTHERRCDYISNDLFVSGTQAQ